MLASVRGSLLSGAGSSSSIAPSVSSRLAIQTRLASVKAFSNSGPKRQKKDKPPREKVSPPFLPLPPNQIGKFVQQTETGLAELPTLPKSEHLSKFVGKAVRFPPTDGGMMKSFGLPRNVLVDFRLLSTPCSVLRKATRNLAERLDTAADGSSINDRIVMTGSPGCGKSYLMLQTVSYALASSWLVLYIPRAHKLVDSSTAYIYDPRSQIYLQPTASSQILQRFLSVNRKLIDQLKVTKEVTFEKRSSVSAGEQLRALINVAMTEQHLAPMVLTAVLEELGKQQKFPVLLAIDEFQSLYCKTEYRNQQYEHIKSYHLSLPRLLMEYASGKNAFNRGVVLSAISSSLSQYPVVPELQRALMPEEPCNQYTKFKPALVEYTQGLEPLRVPDKLEYNEAAALFEIWMKDGALHTSAADELFLSKYSESAGNARDFVHGGLLATLSS